MEDGETLQHVNVGEEGCEAADEKTVDSTSSAEVAALAEEEHEAITDVASEEEEVEYIDDNDNGSNNSNCSVEVINHEVKSPPRTQRVDRISSTGPEATWQYFSHNNVDYQLRHHDTDDEKDDDNNHGDLSTTMALYTPSSFMQSLRGKYLVGM